jgi:beta-N-acetylhexosaminidase
METTTTRKQGTESGPAGEDLLIGQLQVMSLDNKIGQLIMAGYNTTAEAEQIIRDISPGGLILFRRNIRTELQTRQDISSLQGAVAEGLPPLFIAVDQEGGVVSRLPASAGSFESAMEIGILHEWGFNVNCAPVLDIGGNPDNKVIGTRAYGQTADEVIVYGLAVLQGLQNAGMLAVIKHFPGHGDTATDSHLALPVIDQPLAQLQEEALRPFIAALAAGADMVMMAHIQFSQLDTRPASLSPVLVDALLRRNLGFAGIVLTDDLTMGAITDHYELGEAAVMAVEAGCDLLLVCHDIANVYLVRDALMAAARSGRLSEARIDASVRRILLAKSRLP